MSWKEAVVGMCVAALAVAATTTPAAAVDDLSLNVSPATECVSTGETVTVTLDVANLSAGINGAQVRLSYDPSLMTLVDIVPTDLGLSPPAAGWVEVSQGDASGSVTWAATINGGSIGISHTIATLTFTAIADGTAGVAFRPDVDPLFTKLTRASNSATIFPNKLDSGGVFIGPPDCTITSDAGVCDGTAGHFASVADAGIGATYAWTVTGGTITAGAGTSSITYTAGSGPTVTIDVTVTDADGCSSSCQNIVTVNPNPDATITAAATVCASTTGHLASVADAGVGAVYAWTVTGGTITLGAGTNQITFSAGVGPNVTVDVTVTDANGCTSSSQLVIGVAAPDCTITGDAAVCDGTSGHVASVPDAGVGATYSWVVTGGTLDSGQGTTSISYTATDPVSVTLDVTVMSGDSCQSSCQKIVGVDANPIADAGLDVTVCADAADPSVGGVSTGSGGTGPYTYAWTGTGAAFLSSTIVANPTFGLLAAGPGSFDACVTVTDTNGCVSATDCALVTVNANPVADAGLDVVVCGDAADPAVGGVSTGSGGTGPYTYAWTGTGAVYLSSTIVANPTFGVLAAGPGSFTACVTVTDANGCVSLIDCATVTVNANPVADAGLDVTVCGDAADPAVGGVSTGSGGTGPYTYAWTGTGAIYLSSTIVANPTFGVVTAGAGSFDACVTVTDANGCVSPTDCALVTVNANPVADAGLDVTVCGDAADPTVGGVSTGSGGTGPYTYAWTGTGALYLSSAIVANPTFDVASAGAGTFDACVTVTDANGCVSVTDCALVTVNAVPTADAGSSFSLCANAPDPTLGGAPTASGGTGPYTYAWTGTGAIYLSSTIVANPTFDVASAGVGSFDACVTVTDANGCVSATSCATLTINLVLDCSITTPSPVCADSSQVATVANAGVGATYAWTVTGGTLDSGQNTDTIGYTAGTGATVTIDVTVTDSNGCTNTCQTIVTVDANPVADAGLDVVVCGDAADPTVGGVSTGSGGTGPYTYAWTGTGAVYLSSTIAANPTFDVLSAGAGSFDACVTVTDANGCVSVIDCALVTVNANPAADAGLDVTVCGDAADPTVGGVSTGSGGTGPYTYAWTGTGAVYLSSTIAANPTFGVLAAGPGSFDACATVTDANGCVSAVDCAVVTVNANPVADAGLDETVCGDAADPAVGGAPTASGGTGPYTYAWSGTGALYLSDTLASNPTFGVLAAGPGTYDACVTVTDANGCVSLIDCAVVTVNALPGCTITSPDLVCAGTSGHAASAPAGAVNYVWSVTGGTLDSGQGTAAITYSAGLGTSLTLDVTVTDANGCISTCQKIVTVDTPDCTISADAAVCYASTGNLATTPPGAVSYVWTVTGGTLTSQIGNSITFAAGTGASVTLEVTVTNANGCVSTCQEIVPIIQPSIDVTLDLEAVSSAVTRDVTFAITDCGGSVDTRVLPVTTDATGVGTVSITSTNPAATWISVQEGHTLRRLAPLTYGACSVATVNLTGADELTAGDFHTATVPQDNLVDITDFSILASRWNAPVDPNLSTGADATGDGLQGSADFAAIQTNFFLVGQAAASCPQASPAPDGIQIVDVEPTRIDAIEITTGQLSIPVDRRRFPETVAADLNADGVVDGQDIRAFARQHGIELQPRFNQLLDKQALRKEGRGVRGR